MPANVAITNNPQLSPYRTSGEHVNYSSFAVIKADGSVVTWGNGNSGGNSSAVAEQLDGTINVTQIYSSSDAFAAIRSDGSVVTWGNDRDAGEFGVLYGAVASQLDGTIDAIQIFSNSSAFAAIRSDGSVVTWGNVGFLGADSSTVASKLDGTIDVAQIYSSNSAFAALRSDGSVVTWGGWGDGGDSSAVASQLDGSIKVTQICPGASSFAAIRSDGSVVTWGQSNVGGDSSSVADQIDGKIDVTQIYSNGLSFAAIRSDGSVVTWGEGAYGGDSSTVVAQLDGTIDVTKICASARTYAAIRSDGSVVSWGEVFASGDGSDLAAQLDGTIDVTEIYSNMTAFAAIRSDGSVVTWGLEGYISEYSSAVAAQLDGTIDVIQIYSTNNAFAAIRSDGSVVAWGGTYGATDGDITPVATELDGTIDVTQILSTDNSFAALRSDGSVVTWGQRDTQYVNGGVSYNSVASQLTSSVISGANIYTNDVVTYIADTTAPTISSFNPTDGSSDVSTTANIVVTLSEDIQRGSGNIVIKTAVGTTVESFNAATSNRLSISDSILTIDPACILANSTKYFVTFEAGAVDDLDGNSYAGTTTYDFTTVSSGQMGLPGFDKAYYLNVKLDALQEAPGTAWSWVNKDTAYLESVLIGAGFTAESHYMAYGYQEGLAPNAFFNPTEYKLAKATDMFTHGGYGSIAAAEEVLESAWPYDFYQHYIQYGSKEGINPSNTFDESSYYESKLVSLQSDPLGGWIGKTSLDLKALFDSLNITPLQHYLMSGANEGIVATSVPPGERVGSAAIANDMGMNQAEINLVGVEVSAVPISGLFFI